MIFYTFDIDGFVARFRINELFREYCEQIDAACSMSATDQQLTEFEGLLVEKILPQALKLRDAAELMRFAAFGGDKLGLISLKYNPAIRNDA